MSDVIITFVLGFNIILMLMILKNQKEHDDFMVQLYNVMNDKLVKLSQLIIPIDLPEEHEGETLLSIRWEGEPMSDRDTIERAIRHIDSCLDVDPWARDIAIDAMKRLLEQASYRQVTGKLDDTISRQTAIDAVENCEPGEELFVIKSLPSALPEPLTDKEQRIFLAAMGREEKVCKQVDDEYRDCRESYEDSLVKTCREITRKVKGALWMT